MIDSFTYLIAWSRVNVSCNAWGHPARTKMSNLKETSWIGTKKRQKSDSRRKKLNPSHLVQKTYAAYNIICLTKKGGLISVFFFYCWCAGTCVSGDIVILGERLLNSEDLTVYKFDYSAVDGKPEVQFKCLKKLVGERGFEPPTPWSRTRCSTRLSHSPTKVSPFILLHVT